MTSVFVGTRNLETQMDGVKTCEDARRKQPSASHGERPGTDLYLIAFKSNFHCLSHPICGALL